MWCGGEDLHKDVWPYQALTIPHSFLPFLWCLSLVNTAPCPCVTGAPAVPRGAGPAVGGEQRQRAWGGPTAGLVLLWAHGEHWPRNMNRLVLCSNTEIFVPLRSTPGLFHLYHSCQQRYYLLSSILLFFFYLLNQLKMEIFFYCAFRHCFFCVDRRILPLLSMLNL